MSIVDAKARSAIPFSDYGHGTTLRASAFLDDKVGFELINPFIYDFEPDYRFVRRSLYRKNTRFQQKGHLHRLAKSEFLSN